MRIQKKKHIVECQSFTSMSPTFKDQEVLEDGTDTLSRNVAEGLPFDAA
jgi:hypothetical protein